MVIPAHAIPVGLKWGNDGRRGGCGGAKTLASWQPGSGGGDSKPDVSPLSHLFQLGPTSCFYHIPLMSSSVD